MKKPCMVDGCERPARTRGWCQTHYLRWWKHGDVAVVIPNGPKRSFEERFWARVDKGDGCWPWRGAKTERGYGYLVTGGDDNRRTLRASRVAWELTNGPIPAGLYACHHCDNPVCVRPDHLFLGTQLDNMRDCKAKGRLEGRRTRWDVTADDSYDALMEGLRG